MCIMEITGLCTGLSSAAVTGEAWLIGEIIEAHLATAPAVLVVLGITAGLFGILPRLMTLVGWLAVAVMPSWICSANSSTYLRGFARCCRCGNSPRYRPKNSSRQRFIAYLLSPPP